MLDKRKKDDSIRFAISQTNKENLQQIAVRKKVSLTGLIEEALEYYMENVLKPNNEEEANEHAIEKETTEVKRTND